VVRGETTIEQILEAIFKKAATKRKNWRLTLIKPSNNYRMTLKPKA
jgi:hypothetical protein